MELGLALSHGLHWHPETLSCGGTVLQRFLLPASAASWGCERTACLYTESGQALFRRFTPVPKQTSSFSEHLQRCSCTWMIPQSPQQDQETQTQSAQLFPRVCQTLHVAGSQLWPTSGIVFSACLALPDHPHPFPAGKVALCATSALSLWQCQALNTSLDLVT